MKTVRKWEHPPRSRSTRPATVQPPGPNGGGTPETAGSSPINLDSKGGHNYHRPGDIVVPGWLATVCTASRRIATIRPFTKTLPCSIGPPLSKIFRPIRSHHSLDNVFSATPSMRARLTAKLPFPSRGHPGFSRDAQGLKTVVDIRKL